MDKDMINLYTFLDYVKILGAAFTWTGLSLIYYCWFICIIFNNIIT